MRFAIFSDIHSNLEALEVVLADARDNKCTDFVCLGDVVGYNANPHECVARIREMDCPIVKGNHDEQASLIESSRDFNEMAEAAIQWTRDNLTDADKEWLRALKLQRQVRDFTIVHATLDTPEQWGYVFNNLDAAASFTYQHTSVVSSGTPMCRWPSCATTACNVSASTSCGSIRAKNILLIPAASASRAMPIGARRIAFITSRARWSNNGG